MNKLSNEIAELFKSYSNYMLSAKCELKSEYHGDVLKRSIEATSVDEIFCNGNLNGYSTNYIEPSLFTIIFCEANDGLADIYSRISDLEVITKLLINEFSINQIINEKIITECQNVTSNTLAHTISTNEIKNPVGQHVSEYINDFEAVNIEVEASIDVGFTERNLTGVRIFANNVIGTSINHAEKTIHLIFEDCYDNSNGLKRVIDLENQLEKVLGSIIKSKTNKPHKTQIKILERIINKRFAYS